MPSTAASARLAAIVESSADAIFAVAADGRVTAWNPAAEALYGWPAADIIGRSVSVLIPAERAGEMDEILGDILAGGVLRDLRTERLTRGGERIHIAMTSSPIRDETGAVVGVSTIARDDSARIAAEAEHAYLETVIGHSADAIIALDRDGVITSWNPAAERMYGVSAAEVIGTQSARLSGGDTDRDVVLAAVLAGETRRYEARRQSRDGRPLILDATLSPLRDPSEAIVGTVTVARDVTASHEVERLLHELHQTRRLESVGHLAGGIAHDFNNLLGIILNYAAFAAEAVPAGSTTREDLEQIQRAAERGAALTRQLLHFSRSEAVHSEVIDLNAVVRDLRPLLEKALGPRVTLELELGADLWPVTADRGQLEQVLMNLAVNGRDAMSGSGRLTVATANTIRPSGSTSCVSSCATRARA